MRNLLLGLALASALLLPAARGDAAETVTVTAVGQGVVMNGDTALARDKAIEDALRKAVEQAVGTIVASETMVENFVMLNDRIYTRSKGYVSGYKILKDGPAEMNVYPVEVEARVSTGSLTDDLGAMGLLVARKNKPRVMFMVAEQNIGSEEFAFWWSQSVQTHQVSMSVIENVLMDKFAAAGFPVVDHAVKSGEIQVSNAYQILELNNENIQRLGNLFDAELVIYGKAYAKQQGRLMNTQMNSVNGNGSLRVVRTDTGQVIATATATAAGLHIDEITAGQKALEKVGEELGDILLERIMNAWTSETSGAQMVELTVSGYDSYTTFARFKKALTEQVRGVKGVHERTVEANTALVHVDMQGSARDLADELVLKSYDGFKADVKRVTDNTLEIVLSSR